MGKETLLIAFLLFLLLLVVIPVILRNYFTKKQNRVCFKDHCFSVELAITAEERSNGLMFRESLDPKKGMLFVFEKEGKHTFWMKNTLISLDIIWINEKKEIVFINQNTPPCREQPCRIIEPAESAKYVLEINGGISKEIGLIVGDKINIEYSK